MRSSPHRRRLAMAGLAAAGVSLALSALAVDKDARGWTRDGTVAARAAAVMTGPEARQEVVLPRELVKKVEGPTVLVYFSPTCPHCKHVAVELQGLSERLEGHGRLVGVAGGNSSAEDLAAFREAHGVRFDIWVDEAREVSRALGIRSTPSAVLVHPKSKTSVEVVDLWFPYVPGLDSMVEGRVRGDMMSPFEPGRYQGTTFCGTCHEQEHAAWQLTHHAVAWRTMERKESETDPTCVGCHVTGWEQPGGWSMADGGHSKLVDVGCESCHGPGGPHDGEAADPSAACAGCHDADHSIGFDLAKGLPLVDHFAATTLSEEAIRDRRRALYDGSAPQELIAFPEGKNLGAAACIGCHAAEHAAWTRDPHSRAMTTLQAKGSAGEVGCVQCHATAKAAGPAPTELSGFRLFEGVACESCHGPGEAHVASGGAPDTIEGLGDDCPVCVIDAVCTSCHTPEMDPTWELEADLPKVAHTPVQ